MKGKTFGDVPLRIGQLRGVFERLIEPKFAVLFLSLVAFFIRLIPMRFKYLLGYDPYFHLAYIKYVLVHEWVNFFPYARGPWGIQIRLFHPLGLWMVPIYLHKVLSPLGVSLYDAFRLTPPLFGVLTVLAVYLAVLRLYGRNEAFFSAFILAVSFGHVSRSMAGYYRGDNYMLFWYSIALLGTALGLTWKPRKWKYERLVFYLIPGLATGISAIFWSAYYPIFGFVLSGAILLSIGAFIIEYDEKMLDGLVLTVSTAFGAVMANSLGGFFGYGMLGYDHWLGKKFAEELGIQFGYLKDAFLILYLKYIIPILVLVVLFLFALGRFIKTFKDRLVVVGIFVLLFIGGIGYFHAFVQELIGRIFINAPIVETQRTGINDLWSAYGPVITLVPFFLLSFRRKKPGDYLVLGLAMVSLPMLLVWSRFLFIGSVAVSIMAGVGLVNLRDFLRAKLNTKKWVSGVLMFVLLLVPIVTAFEGVQHTLSVRPFMNDNWKEALTYLGNHSGLNDVILTWWDEGHWVTYYAMRAPVAQGGPSKWVARYYLGNKTELDLMKLGVDYIIVSLDAISKFGSIIQTANASGYAMVLLSPVSSGDLDTLAFSSPGYIVLVSPEHRWDVRVGIGDTWGVPRGVFVEMGRTLAEVPLKDTPTIGAYVYINLNYGYAVLMNEKAFNTPLARLMFTNNYSSSYRLVYSDGGIVKVFRFVHPNVIVEAGNNSVVLRFENASGTSLGIYGYLDNGTLVFKKWYDVRNKSEFVLPENLNGSVVIRYTYSTKKIVLDRGVFRLEDMRNLEKRR